MKVGFLKGIFGITIPSSGQILGTSHGLGSQKVAFGKGKSLISGKSRLVKYYNLASLHKARRPFLGEKLWLSCCRFLCLFALDPGDVGAALAEAIRWPAIGGKLEEAHIWKQQTSIKLNIGALTQTLAI